MPARPGMPVTPMAGWISPGTPGMPAIPTICTGPVASPDTPAPAQTVSQSDSLLPLSLSTHLLEADLAQLRRGSQI